MAEARLLRRKERLTVSIGQGLTAASLESETYDLADGGLYVVGVHQFAAGEKVTVRFSDESDESPLAIACEVAWVDETGASGRPPGAGLKFLSSDSADELPRLLDRLARQEEQNLAAHPVWARHSSPDCPKALSIGWLIEHYHLHVSMFNHLPVAIRRAPDVEVKSALTKHLYFHRESSFAIVELLVEFGVDGNAVARAQPLPATAGCIAYLAETAYCDLTGYVALVSWGEPRRSLEHSAQNVNADPNKLNKVFERQRKARQLGRNIFQLVPAVSPAEQRRAMQALLSWFAMYTMLIDQVREYYERPDAVIPRPPSASTLD